MHFKANKLSMAVSHIRTSNHIIVLLSIILLGVFTGGYLVIEQLNTLKKDAYAINNLGAIRGSIQLISKRELNAINSDQQIKKVDSIFLEIKQNYLAHTSNYDYIKKYEINPLVDSLEQSWQILKHLYIVHRTKEDRSVDVMAKSEECWELADDLVYRVQKISESKLMHYRDRIIQILGIISVFVILIITIVYQVINKVLERDAISDSLTNLYNRKYFTKILFEQVALYERYGTSFTLTLIDIDHFKQINDQFGHPQGDKALKMTARILKDNSREVDYVFRIGGEEFAVISPHSKLKATEKLAEKYRKLIAKSDFGIERSMIISIGIADYYDNCTIDGIYRNADSALYEAKSSGRNQVISFSL